MDKLSSRRCISRVYSTRSQAHQFRNAEAKFEEIFDHERNDKNGDLFSNSNIELSKCYEPKQNDPDKSYRKDDVVSGRPTLKKVKPKVSKKKKGSKKKQVVKEPKAKPQSGDLTMFRDNSPEKSDQNSRPAPEEVSKVSTINKSRNSGRKIKTPILVTNIQMSSPIMKKEVSRQKTTRRNTAETKQKITDVCKKTAMESGSPLSKQMAVMDKVNEWFARTSVSSLEGDETEEEIPSIEKFRQEQHSGMDMKKQLFPDAFYANLGRSVKQKAPPLKSTYQKDKFLSQLRLSPAPPLASSKRPSATRTTTGAEMTSTPVKRIKIHDISSCDEILEDIDLRTTDALSEVKTTMEVEPLSELLTDTEANTKDSSSKSALRHQSKRQTDLKTKKSSRTMSGSGNTLSTDEYTVEMLTGTEVSQSEKQISSNHQTTNDVRESKVSTNLQTDIDQDIEKNSLGMFATDSVETASKCETGSVERQETYSSVKEMLETERDKSSQITADVQQIEFSRPSYTINNKKTLASTVKEHRKEHVAKTSSDNSGTKSKKTDEFTEKKNKREEHFAKPASVSNKAKDGLNTTVFNDVTSEKQCQKGSPNLGLEKVKHCPKGYVSDFFSLNDGENTGEVAKVKSYLSSTTSVRPGMKLPHFPSDISAIKDSLHQKKLDEQTPQTRPAFIVPGSPTKFAEVKVSKKGQLLPKNSTQLFTSGFVEISEAFPQMSTIRIDPSLNLEKQKRKASTSAKVVSSPSKVVDLGPVKTSTPYKMGDKPKLNFEVDLSSVKMDSDDGEDLLFVQSSHEVNSEEIHVSDSTIENHSQPVFQIPATEDDAANNVHKRKLTSQSGQRQSTVKRAVNSDNKKHFSQIERNYQIHRNGTKKLLQKNRKDIKVSSKKAIKISQGLSEKQSKMNTISKISKGKRKNTGVSVKSNIIRRMFVSGKKKKKKGGRSAIQNDRTSSEPRSFFERSVRLPSTPLYQKIDSQEDFEKDMSQKTLEVCTLMSRYFVCQHKNVQVFGYVEKECCDLRNIPIDDLTGILPTTMHSVE